MGALENVVRGRQVWIDRALLATILFVALAFPLTACGAAVASPRVLEAYAARVGCFVVFALSLLLAIESRGRAGVEERGRRRAPPKERQKDRSVRTVVHPRAGTACS